MLRLDIIGFAAAILSTVCWLPQTIRTIRTRDTKSLSLPSQGTLLLAVGLWCLYGFLTGDAPLLVSNGISFVLVGTLLAMKLRYG